MLVVPRFSLLRVKAILLVISAVMALGPTTMAWADVAGVIDAQILSLSDSQKTVLLNIGKRERVRSGDWLVLIKDTQDKDGLRYRLVARGRVLRSSPKRAMVMLYKVHAKDLLARLGYSKIRCFFGDGTKGLPDFAPYDKIIVTAGAPVVPEALKNQLRISGRLIIPVGEDVQYMYRITRLSDMEFKEEILDAFRFVPFLEGVQKQK